MNIITIISFCLLAVALILILVLALVIGILKRSQRKHTRRYRDQLAMIKQENYILKMELDEKTISTISPRDLKKLLQSIPAVQEVDIDTDDDLIFTFLDKDNDLMAARVVGVNTNQLTIATPFQMPEDYLFSSALAANTWNQQADIGDTYAFAVGGDEVNFVILESDLLLTGGVSSENIRNWLASFLETLDTFEDFFPAEVKELDFRDSQLRKRGFWGAVGSFLGEYNKNRDEMEMVFDITRTIGKLTGLL